jgi:tetratricopeptide (TPR) repeat protein
MISPVKRMEADKGDLGYELAHERLIPALRRLAGKQLSEVDRVNQLLDRRVNEWQGNNRSWRYLLTWRELHRIRQQHTFLVWGPQKSAKESLIAKSRRRVHQWQALASVPVVAALCMFLAYYSTRGQLYLVRQDLRFYASRGKNDETLAEIAIAYLAERNFILAQQLTDRIRDPYVLISIAESYIKLGDTERAKILLQRALPKIIPGRIYPNVEARGHSAAAKAYIKLNDVRRATSELEEALPKAGYTYSGGDGYRARELCYVAEGIEKLNNTRLAEPLLAHALQITEEIRDNEYKSRSFISIAEAYTKLNIIDRAALLLKHALTSIDKTPPNITPYGRVVNPGFWGASSRKDVNCTFSSEDFRMNYIDDIEKSHLLSDIAEVAGELNDLELATPLLKQVVQRAENFNSKGAKASPFSSAIKAYIKLNNTERAASLLDRVVQDDIDKINVIVSIAEVYIKLNDAIRARPLLERALQSAEVVSRDHWQFHTLDFVAKSYIKLNDVELVAPLLDKALQSAERLSADERTSALCSIAELYLRLNDAARSLQLL